MYMNTSLYLKQSGRFYYLSFFIVFIIISIILYVFASSFSFDIYQIIFGLFILYFVVACFAFLYFQNFYIYIESEIIIVKEGLIIHKMIAIPFDKINEITIKYTFADKILGIGTIIIDTTGTDAVEIIFPNVLIEKIHLFINIFKQWEQDKNSKK